MFTFVDIDVREIQTSSGNESAWFNQNKLVT